MNSRLKYLFKNTGILVLSGFASKLLGFFLVPLYTSVLSTEEFGKYDIIVSTLTILLPIVTLNIADAVMRFSMEKEKDPHNAAAVGLRFVVTGTVIVALLSLIIEYTPLYKYVEGFRAITVFYFIAIAFNSYFTQLAKGNERVLDMGIAGIIGTVATLAANILLLLVFRMGLKGFFFAGILGSAIPDIYYFFRLKTRWYFKTAEVKKGYVKEMISYSAPLALVVIGWAVNSNFDKYMVTAFCGLATNGLLAIAYKIPNILNAFQGIFNQAWQISAISEYKSDDSGEFYRTMITYTLSVSSVLSALLIILTRPIASLFYAKEFYEAWQYVPFLLISFLFNFAAGIIGPILSAKMDSKTMAKSAAGGIVVNIVLNYILIKAIGVQGVTIATAVSSFCIFIIRRIAIKDILKIKDDITIIISAVLLSALATVEILLQNYIAELCLLLVIIGLNRKLIKAVLTILRKNTKEKASNEDSGSCTDKT